MGKRSLFDLHFALILAGGLGFRVNHWQAALWGFLLRSWAFLGGFFYIHGCLLLRQLQVFLLLERSIKRLHEHTLDNLLFNTLAFGRLAGAGPKLFFLNFRRSNLVFKRRDFVANAQGLRAVHFARLRIWQLQLCLVALQLLLKLRLEMLDLDLQDF